MPTSSDNISYMLLAACHCIVMFPQLTGFLVMCHRKLITLASDTGESKGLVSMS